MFVLTDEAAEKRDKFLGLLFKETEGFVCISRKRPNSRAWFDDYFKWPNDRLLIQAHIRRFFDWDLYFCPALLDERKLSKETIRDCPVAWADLDTCDPEHLLVLATFEIESSPGRYQAYWLFEEFMAPLTAEDISRRIAYQHKDQGADVSGWDLTQRLRIPFTNNYKYGGTGEAPLVTIIKARNVQYTPQNFSPYPDVKGFEYTQVEFPNELPDSNDVLMAHRYDLHPHVFTLFSQEPKVKDGDGGWSKYLWQLELLLFESGLKREEVFVVARDSACNKYKRDGRSEVLLWREVCRAEHQIEVRAKEFGPAAKDLTPLLSEGDRSACEQTQSIIEEYVEWAKTTGDAAVQYHQAGAFVVLSALLSGSVRLPTSFGNIIPNLWFLILADTTLTRKTTAMDLATDLLTEIDSDAILATDGSIEGLFSSLAMRPGRPSVFLRDEFSGMVDMMNKREYYAGMAETLTKMYDGKFQKRVLRRETIEVREPVLIFFAGGIKDRVQQLLTFEQVASGFIPRFIVISAESDVTQLKPLGPPSTQNLAERMALIQKLTTIREGVTKHTAVTTSDGRVHTSKKYAEAHLTPDAWLLYNKLESQMLASGLDSDHADLLTPCFDRLSKSGLKASVLLAAARAQEGKVSVDVEDVTRAFYYVEQWRAHTLTLLRNIGNTTTERQIDTIRRAVLRQPGIMRSRLMAAYHLTKRDADNILDTLEQRGHINRQRVGKGERIFAMEE